MSLVDFDFTHGAIGSAVASPVLGPTEQTDLYSYQSGPRLPITYRASPLGTVAASDPAASSFDWASNGLIITNGSAPLGWSAIDLHVTAILTGVPTLTFSPEKTFFYIDVGFYTLLVNQVVSTGEWKAYFQGDGHGIGTVVSLGFGTIPLDARIQWSRGPGYIATLNGHSGTLPTQTFDTNLAQASAAFATFFDNSSAYGGPVAGFAGIRTYSLQTTDASSYVNDLTAANGPRKSAFHRKSQGNARASFRDLLIVRR